MPLSGTEATTEAASPALLKLAGCGHIFHAICAATARCVMASVVLRHLTDRTVRSDKMSCPICRAPLQASDEDALRPLCVGLRVCSNSFYICRFELQWLSTTTQSHVFRRGRRLLRPCLPHLQPHHHHHRSSINNNSSNSNSSIHCALTPLTGAAVRGPFTSHHLLGDAT